MSDVLNLSINPSKKEKSTLSCDRSEYYGNEIKVIYQSRNGGLKIS